MKHRKPKYAILTDYEMSRKDFEEFILGMPNLQDRVNDFESCVCAYYYWKDVLKRPGLPTIKRVLYTGDGTEVYRLRGFPYVASCFFPIRRIIYNEERQLKDNNTYATETEKDKATLEKRITEARVYPEGIDSPQPCILSSTLHRSFFSPLSNNRAASLRMTQIQRK